MPRKAREKYEHSIYHIMVRGNNQQAIFLDEEDKVQYLKRLKRYKEKYKIHIYAYCLMTNHVHLLIYDNGQDISKVMQGLNLSYVIYFNKRHDRLGHLFQDRFNSVMVKKDTYFIEVSKYIHLNPVKANMVSKPEQYRWSSMGIYLGEEDLYKIVDCSRILQYFSNIDQESKELYFEYLRQQESEVIDEVAISAETVNTDESVIKAREVNKDEIIKLLSQHFEIHYLELLKRNNKNYSEQRALAIYIMAVIGRMPYKQLADIFYVKPAAIGVSIKRAISLMVSNNFILDEVNNLIKNIA